MAVTQFKHSSDLKLSDWGSTTSSRVECAVMAFLGSRKYFAYNRDQAACRLYHGVPTPHPTWKNSKYYALYNHEEVTKEVTVTIDHIPLYPFFHLKMMIKYQILHILRSLERKEMEMKQTLEELERYFRKFKKSSKFPAQFYKDLRRVTTSLAWYSCYKRLGRYQEALRRFKQGKLYTKLLIRKRYTAEELLWNIFELCVLYGQYTDKDDHDASFRKQKRLVEDLITKAFE